MLMILWMKNGVNTVANWSGLKALAISAVLLLGIATAQAATLSGRVVGVSDGDTVTVLDAGKTQHKIRLA